MYVAKVSTQTINLYTTFYIIYFHHRVKRATVMRFAYLLKVVPAVKKQRVGASIHSRPVIQEPSPPLIPSRIYKDSEGLRHVTYKGTMRLATAYHPPLSCRDHMLQDLCQVGFEQLLFSTVYYERAAELNISQISRRLHAHEFYYRYISTINTGMSNN